MKQRITLRDIAEKVGLTRAAVSMALRNDQRLPEETRRRVREAAAELGYRPDPELGRVLSAVRRAGRFQPNEVVAFLYHGERFSEYNQEILRVADSLALELGLILQGVDLAGIKSKQGLGRRLDNMGAHGLAILPMPDVQTLPSLDWDRFALVSFNRLPIGPVMHRVLPDHGKFPETALLRLRELGFRKIGFLTSNYNVQALSGYPLYGFLRAAATLGMTPPPPTGCFSAKFDQDEGWAWLQREKPDALILTDEDWIGVLRKKGLPMDYPVVSLGAHCHNKGVYRVYQHPEVIAERGIRFLTGLLSQNELGIPTHPLTILVPGEWMEIDAADRLVRPPGNERAPRGNTV